MPHSHTHIRKYAHINKHKHTYPYIHTHKETHAHIYAYTHAHKDRHTVTHTQPRCAVRTSRCRWPSVESSVL